jgi:4-amino-4-deoxy-L-arabinose transferase-like glycosyltransferase
MSARRQKLGSALFVLPVLWAMLAGALAYQLPFQTRIDVGNLGDQFFFRSSEAQGQQQNELGRWHVDQLDSPGRSRWSRSRGAITLPGVGQGRDLNITLFAAGWPADVARSEPQQPEVTVLLDQEAIGSFTPRSDAVAPFPVTVPAALQSGPALELTLRSSATFTDTLTYSDGREKGIRLDTITIAASGWGARPDWSIVGGLGLATALAMGSTLSLGGSLAAERRRRLALLLGVGVATLGGSLLALGRLWLAALLPALLFALLLLLLLTNLRRLVRLTRGLGWRLRSSNALNWSLIALLAGSCAYLLALIVVPRLMAPAAPADLPVNPEASDRVARLLTRVSLYSGAALALLVGVTILPQWVLSLRRRLLTGRLAPALLAVFAAIWLGYEVWLIATLPFVGHADYADNAVVARNLLRGRGWVVDYVSQFYAFAPNGSVTRPQETWPLLQPLLMLPAMALLGPTPFAARIGNIALLLVLTALIYHIGARLWDRRVGLIGAILTLTNLLFFRLAIYATSDLALVVWSMTAFWLVFLGLEEQGNQGAREPLALWAHKRTREQRNKGTRQHGLLRRTSWFFVLRSLFARRWLWAGIFTGLMILQKPSSAIFAVGAGLWVLAVLERRRRAAGLSLGDTIRRWLRPLLVWTAVTVLVVSPYLVRNLLVFNKPFFSTEAYDAWILFFRGSSRDAWEDIYKIYDPNFGGPGTPDRSWILRWGFDRTIGKLAEQARDAWYFFAPPRGELLGLGTADERNRGIVATWLMLLGLLVLRRRQRLLIGLVASALIPYTIFLILYWHTFDEPRYFVPFVPWMALLAAWGLCWLFDRIAALWQGRLAGLGGLVLSLALLSAIVPHWNAIDKFLDPKSSGHWGRVWQANLEAYDWLRQNTPPDAVIMTRVPWQLNYHADRPAVMIPNGDMEQILRVAQHYGADYLLLKGTSTSQPERQGGALKPLVDGEQMSGWELVHQVPERFDGGTGVVQIFRFPPNYTLAKKQ